MKQLFKHYWNRVATLLALTCFSIGTLFMMISLMITNEFLLTFGITLLVLYVPITLITLFTLLVNTLVNFKDIQEHVMTLIIVLLNIPIALAYINFLTS